MTNKKTSETDILPRTPCDSKTAKSGLPATSALLDAPTNSFAETPTPLVQSSFSVSTFTDKAIAPEQSSVEKPKQVLIRTASVSLQKGNVVTLRTSSADSKELPIETGIVYFTADELIMLAMHAKLPFISKQLPFLSFLAKEFIFSLSVSDQIRFQKLALQTAKDNAATKEAAFQKWSKPFTTHDLMVFARWGKVPFDPKTNHPFFPPSAKEVLCFLTVEEQFLFREWAEKTVNKRSAYFSSRKGFFSQTGRPSVLDFTKLPSQKFSTFTSNKASKLYKKSCTVLSDCVLPQPFKRSFGTKALKVRNSSNSSFVPVSKPTLKQNNRKLLPNKFFRSVASRASAHRLPLKGRVLSKMQQPARRSFLQRFRKQVKRSREDRALSIIREFDSRSSLILKARNFKSSVLFHAIDRAKKQTVTAFSKTRKKLYRSLSRSKKVYALFNLYGRRGFRAGQGQLRPYVKLDKSRRPLLSREVSENSFTYIKNKDLKNRAIGFLTTGLYNLNVRFFSTSKPGWQGRFAVKRSIPHTEKVIEKNSKELSKFENTDLLFSKRLQSRRRKVLKARLKRRLKIEKKSFKPLLKGVLKKQQLRDYSSKKYILSLSKKIRNRRLKQRGHRLFKKRRRAFRSCRGWKRNLFRRLTSRKYLVSMLKLRRRSKKKLNSNLFALSTRYRKSSFALLFDLQKKLQSNFSTLTGLPHKQVLMISPGSRVLNPFLKKQKNSSCSSRVFPLARRLRFRSFLRRASMFSRRKVLLTSLRKHSFSRKRSLVTNYTPSSFSKATMSAAVQTRKTKNQLLRQSLLLGAQPTLRSALLAKIQPEEYVTNRFYKRSLLRRRLRGALLARLRRKLKRTSPHIFPTLFELGQKKAPYNRKLNWRRRKLEKKVVNRLSSLAYGKASANLPVLLPSIGTAKSRFISLRNKQQLRSFRASPRFTLAYRLLFRRWHSRRNHLGEPIARPWPSRAEVRRRARMNLIRFRRGLPPKKVQDPVFYELEKEVGSSSSIGYRRIRRSLQFKFNTTRWWKASALPSPLHSTTGRSYLKSNLPSLSNLKGDNNLGSARKTLSTLKTAKRTGLQRASNWKTYLPSLKLSENNSWRALEDSVTGEFSTRNTASGWSRSRIEALFRELETGAFSGLWPRCALILGTKEAEILRKGLIDNSSAWLVSRYFEKNLQNQLLNKNSFSVTTYTSTVIFLNRSQLFKRFPNWWAEETYRRLRALDISLNLLATQSSFVSKELLPWKLMSVLKQQVCGETSDYMVSSMQTEKEVIKLVLPFISNTEKAVLFKDLFLGLETRPKLTDKSLSTPYQQWLRGVEGYMKKFTLSRSSQDHVELRKKTITILGTDQPRFPGIGRRKATYDSAVRAFYKKTVSARFRRVQGLRFRHLRPTMSKNFYARAPMFESSSCDRRSSRKHNSFARVRYLNRHWRKLLNTRNLTSFSNKSFQKSVADLKPENTAFKRRLTSSPAMILSSANNKQASLSQSAGFDATGETLLLSALASRAKNRELQELMLHSSRRLLPLEQILPPWMLAGKLRKQRKSRQSNKSDYMLPGQYEAMSNAYWVTSCFSVSVPRQLQSLDTTASVTGENFHGPVALYKAKGAKLGWTLQRNKRKVSRFRFVLKRYRGSCFKKVRRPSRNKRYLYKAKRKFRNTRRTRKAVSRAWRGLKRVAACRLFKKYTKASTKFNYRLTQTKNQVTSLSPMLFSKKTREVVISDQEKTRQKEGMALRKQEHYKKTAQLAENFTTMFSQLISLLIERQFSKKTLSIKEMRAAVHSVYWSVRYFLQKDRTGNRLAARDVSQAQFSLLRNQLVRDTEDRYFDLNDLKTLRYRFQPHKLVYSKQLNRGAVDWLRMFFPRYHSLYLEDPEAYKNFFLTPIKTFRSHPSRKNPGEWQTTSIPGLMQNRFKRLTNPKDWQNSSRFESLLMTTRRSPVIAGRGAAARLRSVSFSGSLSPKGSFFNRSYSTHARDLISSRISYLGRHIVDSSRPISDAAAVSNRYVLKARAYARTRTNYVMNKQETGAGALDLRFSRLKSPRNRQFLQRLSTNSATSLTFKRKLFKDSLYAHLFSLNSASSQAFPRRTLRKAQSRTVSFLQTNGTSPVLLKSRKQVSTRRVNSFLNTRAFVLQKSLVSFVEKKLFTKKHRAAFVSKKGLKNLPYINSLQKSQEEIVANSRSILNYRKAQNRSVPLFYSKQAVIARKSVLLKRPLRSFLNSYELRVKLARNVLSSRLRRASHWYQKESLTLLRKKLKKSTTSAKLRLVKTTVKLASAQKRSSNFLLKYKFLNFQPFLKKANKSYVYRAKTNFVSQAWRLHHNSKIVSDFLATQEHLALENPEATGRQELWNAITLRWMKKHRVLKNWLKDAKRGLKKINWDFLPEVLFKSMRSRLRKLEWREPDEHFNRDGFRNAFRFFPGERRKAPWLEKLMYRRALYSTLRGSYRRYQFPREQKRLKWLQQYRKALFPTRRSAKYIKKRRWPKLRIYNQRLFRGMFSLRNKRTAQRHFQKLSRRKPVDSGFSKALTGLGDRLDVNLVLLNIAPTIFWAKVLAAFGLFRVNNEIVKDPSFRFKKNDRIHWNWVMIERLRIYFQPVLGRYETARRQNTSSCFPKNFEYFPGIRTAIYKRLPTPADLPKNSRLSYFLFRMFQADSGSGK